MQRAPCGAFPEALDAVCQEYKPNQLTNYLFETANSFSSFYDACPIKGEADEADDFLSGAGAVSIDEPQPIGICLQIPACVHRSTLAEIGWKEQRIEQMCVTCAQRRENISHTPDLGRIGAVFNDTQGYNA